MVQNSCPLHGVCRRAARILPMEVIQRTYGRMDQKTSQGAWAYGSPMSRSRVSFCTSDHLPSIFSCGLISYASTLQYRSVARHHHREGSLRQLRSFGRLDLVDRGDRDCAGILCLRVSDICRKGAHYRGTAERADYKGELTLRVTPSGVVVIRPTISAWPRHD